MDFTFVIYLLILATGVGVLITGRSILRARRSHRWPQVPGEITASRLVERSVRANLEYGPYVRYRYRVRGQSYENGRIEFFQEWFRQKDPVLDILQQYAEGSSVTVYHHPRKPELSVLKTGVHSVQYALAAAFVLFFLAFIYWLWADAGIIQWLIRER